MLFMDNESLPFNLRVFISSTESDLREYRQAAFDAIQSLGAHGDDMIYWSADPRSGAQHSVDRIRKSDIVILLIAHRYGFVPNGSQFSITEMEYQEARTHGIPVLAYFLDESQPWPPDQVEWEKVNQLRAFKQRVEGDVTRKTFKSTDELGRLVTQALALYMERHRNRLSGAGRFKDRALRVDSSIALIAQPDTSVHIGPSEDGLPLIFQVMRSRDLNRNMEALVSEIVSSSNAVAALLSSFRQALESYAREAWAGEQILSVQWDEHVSRMLYVSRSNLSQLFQSTFASALGEARAAGAREFLRSRGGASVIGAQTRAQWAESASDATALESEGGQNRFLGIDPQTGDAYSVGLKSGKWVKWRPFIFESILSSLPRARFVVGSDDSSYSVAELSEFLLNYALEGGVDLSGVLKLDITICIARQDLVLLLAEIVQRLSEMHAIELIHGDLKPHNILLGSSGPELIDAFGLQGGDVSPGWTPNWSAPEQILGETVGVLCDIYPIGKMIADILGGELVGEVRKFKARPVDRELSEFDIFYNPSVYLRANSVVSSKKGLSLWVALARQCLRFVPTDRPHSASELRERILSLAEKYPLSEDVRISLPGELRVATLLDGSQVVSRVIGDVRAPVDTLSNSSAASAQSSPFSFPVDIENSWETDTRSDASDAGGSAAGVRKTWRERLRLARSLKPFKLLMPSTVTRRCKAGHPLAPHWATCPYCEALEAAQRK
jgi:serine/threonine protein kinase